MAELALCYENCDRTYSLVQKLRANIFFRYENCGRNYSALRKLWPNLLELTKIVTELNFSVAKIAAELIFRYENFGRTYWSLPNCSRTYFRKCILEWLGGGKA